MSKLFLYHGGNPHNIRVLLLTPSGAAAIYIDGTATHFGLNIPCHGKMSPTSAKNRTLPRSKYFEVNLLLLTKS